MVYLIVGVVGLGTVGKPLFHTLKYHHEIVYGFDKNKRYSWDNIIDTDIVFVCVPTDQGSDGRLDMNVVTDILTRLSDDDYLGVVVVKSTLRLGYITDVVDKYLFEILVFPEWLYMKSALPDTVKPEMLVLGVDDKTLVDIVKEACPWYDYSTLNVVSLEEAVLVKLVANSLASTKISFANQIKLICDSYDIDADRIMDIIKTDPRCASRYLSPGPPFGGYCLPKDTSELANCIKDALLLKGVLKINDKIKEGLD